METSHKERLRKLLHSPPLEEVEKKVDAAWHLGERFPAPKFTPVCPHCHCYDVIFRRMRFFLMGGSPTTPYRCDVFVKCGTCSVTWTYGIVIPKRMFKANEHIGQLGRKDILDALETMDDV